MASGAASRLLEVPVILADFQSIAALAIEHRLPAMFPGGWQHDGLMAYGTSLLQTVLELPRLIGVILNGAKPGDIPVRHVRQHRLRLNLATARKIGLDLSREVVAREGEVISIDG
jgi:putative tryptophan/tyrosine transport system substrate-binding protein